jgi:zinc protease
VVVISGDVTLDDVKKLAADTFGKIPQHDVPPRKIFPALTNPSETRIETVDPGVEQPQLEYDVVAPSYHTQKDREAYAYEVLAETLDGGQVGLLYRDLVAAQGIASGADTNYDPDARGDAVFTIAVVPQPGKNPKDLEKALHEELEKLAKQGIDAKDVESAKKRLTREAIFARDSLVAPGYVFGEALTTGHTVDDVEAWPDRIAAVTPEQVNAALRDLAANSHAIDGLLLPDPNASAAARAAARQPALSKSQSIR